MGEYITGSGKQRASMAFEAATYVLNVNSVASSLYNVSAKVFVREIQRKKTTFFSSDPFAASADFAARFERSAVPSDIGGELTTGTDGHCCLGVEQPALCDEDAVWTKYLSTVQ